MRHHKLIINDDSHPNFFLSYINPICPSFFIKIIFLNFHFWKKLNFCFENLPHLFRPLWIDITTTCSPILFNKWKFWVCFDSDGSKKQPKNCFAFFDEIITKIEWLSSPSMIEVWYNDFIINFLDRLVSISLNFLQELFWVNANGSRILEEFLIELQSKKWIA